MTPVVLIIEDEKILAESMSVYLERHAYATIVAHAGDEGVRLAAEATPDVAIVDLRLPGLDGFEVLERVRRLSPRTEVIIASAHASVGSASEARRRGAFAFLHKPVDLDALTVVIGSALGRR